MNYIWHRILLLISASFLLAINIQGSSSKLDPYIFTIAYKNQSDLVTLQDKYDSIKGTLSDEAEKTLNTIAFCDAIDLKGEHSKALSLLHDLQSSTKFTIMPSIVLAEYNSILGNISIRNENPELAVTQYQKAIGLIDGSFSVEQTQVLYMRLSNGLNAIGDHESAMSYLEKSLNLDPSGKNRNALYIRLNIALTNSYLGNLETAKVYFKEALVLIDFVEDHFAKVRTYGNIADIYAEQDSLELSESYYLQGMVLAKSSGMTLDLIRFHQSLSDLYANHDQYKEAYIQNRISDSISKKYNSSKYSEEIVAIEYHHKIEKEQLLSKMKSQSLKAEREHQTVLYGFIAFLLVAFVLVSLLVIQLNRKNKVLLENSVATTKKFTPSHSGETENLYSELISQLEQLLLDEELVFNQGLTIEMLSKKLQTNRTYLSDAINSHYKMGFSKLINQIRIKAAQKMLVDPSFDHFSVEGIANSVGFSSISSFNSNFKKITGITPSFLRKNRNKI